MVILGISQACYRWVTYPAIQRDQLSYLISARPLPYLQSVAPPGPDEDLGNYLMNRMAELGVTGLYMVSSWLKDRTGAESFRKQIASRGMVYVGGVILNLAADEDEWRAQEFEAAATQIQLCAWGGAAVATAVHSQPARHSHFSKDPPIDAQIERMICNFRSLVPVCEDLGLVLAVENHMDYRLSEIVQLVEGVGSPWIRINLDTANPIGVVEDPLAAARGAAKYTVMMHIKDLRVQPATETGEPRVYWAPIGQGSVPIAEILAVVAAEAPDPASLVACLEVAPPPDHDPHQWVKTSLDWLRASCGQYFDNAAPIP